MNPTLIKVLDRIKTRSIATREQYEGRMISVPQKYPPRKSLSCGNLAHGFAACPIEDKKALTERRVNLGIVSAYNEMLSAHQPFYRFPEIIKEAMGAIGGVAQFAGGVPAMCDGVTQGQPGMDLSLFSRDTIALSTSIALSHNMFDAAVCLGVCDKIVPGMLIGALSFAHLPVMFLPAGPMESGLPNKEKVRIREQFAKGEIGRGQLLEAESKSYHSPGTCTFYGTANSNQMLMEFMGLHLPGSSFVNPSNPLRDALTFNGAQRIASQTNLGDDYRPLFRVITAEAIVNGIVGLLATGGSTNLGIHMVAIARAAGIIIDWSDMGELSTVVPLLTRVYPNGSADVNHFHAAGGLGLVMRNLLDRGLLTDEVETVMGKGLGSYVQEPKLLPGRQVEFVPGPKVSLDSEIIAAPDCQFENHGGLQLLEGNLGRSMIKTSAVADANLILEAPAAVFDSQEKMLEAFKEGKLHRDVIVVVRYQGPKAIGMPELHKLTPSLGVLQNLGYKVALVTDGRMSGASGKIPAAIHLSPEAEEGGAIAKIKDGDVIKFNAIKGTLDILVPDDELAARPLAPFPNQENHWGLGRELFGNFRKSVSSAETGASIFFGANDE